MSANKPHPDSHLTVYRKKRHQGATPEPFGEDLLERPGAFVVQKHAARNLHFDLRLEFQGVLMSWAVPKGFTFETTEKRLAVRTEDHPLDYLDFEGIIPPGNYGAGSMIVWDRGRWVALEPPTEGLEKGKLLFELRGYKLKGVWTLVQTKRNPKEWLLIKKPDAWGDPDPPRAFPEASIFSGLTVEQLAEGPTLAAQLASEIERLHLPPLPVRPEKIEVMLAETSERPFSRAGWLFELKYDGYRLLAIRDGDRVLLRYRSGRDATPLFPEITRALASFPHTHLVLDGEVVILDDNGRPSFQRLQRRAQRYRPVDIQTATVELPATFFAFDLPSYGGFDLRDRSLLERKAYLRRVVPDHGPIRHSDFFEERGEEVFETVSALGLEGIVAKKTSSPYRSGKRSGEWLKIPASHTSFFTIVGYTDPKGARSGFGALHLAGYDNQTLVYAGRVGTGFSDNDLLQLRAALDEKRVEQPPCTGDVPTGAEHTWTEPRLVCSVRYKEFTEQSLLRQPSFLGLREDVPPTDCLLPQRAETPLSAAEPQSTSPRKLHFTNLKKVLWREDGFTKGDLIEYYRSVSRWILPYLQDRLLVMDRYPDGIDGKSFFQKNVPEGVPPWVRTEQVWSSDDTRASTYLVCEDEETLLYVANLASIPLHIWGSRVSRLENPDWCILDLDPTEAPFESVIAVALRIRQLTEACGLPAFIKTSGSKGLHVLIPLASGCGFAEGKMLAELLARLTAHQLSEISTVDRRIADRLGKVYIDYVQNGYGKLLVSPFCVRPRPGAPVSAPLLWDEVAEGLRLSDFTIQTVPQRMEKLGVDPLHAVFHEESDLLSALAQLAAEVDRLS